jgi:hypothetical protein
MTEVTQGELIPAPARVNRHGSKCPPWCSVDHEDGEHKGYVIDCHISARGPRAAVDAVAVQGGYPAAGDITVQLRPGAGPLVSIGVNDAPDMARLLDAIAAGQLTRADCAWLADRVRVAHALITAGVQA